MYKWRRDSSRFVASEESGSKRWEGRRDTEEGRQDVLQGKERDGTPRSTAGSSGGSWCRPICSVLTVQSGQRYKLSVSENGDVQNRRHS
jgi:hypothetical protein